MSGSSKQPWSNNTNISQISHQLYSYETLNLYGTFIAVILYGVVVVLFFQCMDALLNHKRGTIKWGLVVHTVAMFSFLTIQVSMNLDLQSVSYVDNREFDDGPMALPGPFGYQMGPLIEKPVTTVPNIVSFFNMWLADGLLLYRCYIIYLMNGWAIAFPCSMYVASIATSVTDLIQAMNPDDALAFTTLFDYVCYPISLALTILLTLMIIIRLALHGRNMRDALGSGVNAGGPYKAIVTTLVESYALYTVSFIIRISLEYGGSPAEPIFDPIFAATQVIAPFLIILRVAKQRALASGSVDSAGIGSIHFKSQGQSTNDSRIIGDGNPTDSTEADGSTSGDKSPGTESVVEEVSR